MFNKHPKGLIAAALANLGERFGFYTMMAILVLFLQAKFGMNGKEAGFIYSTFYFSIYILALVGGIIADKTRNYKGTIFTGIVLMAVGYLLLAIPSKTPVDNKMLYLVITCASLFVIAFGNGLFKGNLQDRCMTILNMPTCVTPVSLYFICLLISVLFLLRLQL